MKLNDLRWTMMIVGVIAFLMVGTMVWASPRASVPPTPWHHVLLAEEVASPAYPGGNDQANGVDLDYVLTIDDPDSGRAVVTMTVSNLSTGAFEVEEHGYHGLYVNVLTLSAYDANGNPLLVEHFPDSGKTYHGQQADVWRVQCTGLSQIVVQYTVQPGLMDSNLWYRGYIAPDFAILAGEFVFLVPRDSIADSVAVSFNLPTGWIAHTPWTRQDDHYDPAIAEAYIIDSLSISDFALGQFDVYTQPIGTTEVAVAVYSGWPTDVKEELAQRSSNILAYQTSVFGGSVGDYYLAIFCPAAPDGHGIYAGEWSTSQGYSIPFDTDGSYWGKWDMFAHQVFHRWNGWAWGFRVSYRWIGEAPNVLYEMKTITELRIERPYGGMVDELRRYHDKYLQDYVATGKDRPIASSESDLDSFLNRRKGAMVSFLLAKEIYLRTDGVHNMDDFLQVLVQEYGHYMAFCSEETLKSDLAALTGSDFTQFFDDYVYGTTLLPMEWAFEDDDGDGLSNALEIGWDTHPEDEDTDGDGASDGIEVELGTDPLDPNSYPGVKNGSFEEDGRMPAPWRGKKLTPKDKRICNAAHDGSCSFLMKGTKAKKSLRQVVNISGRAGDTFTLSGWSRAKNASPTGGAYCLQAKVKHTDGTKGKAKTCFTKGTHGWEYGETSFTTDKDYNKIIVYLTYKKQGGKAWFDDVGLFPE